MERILLQTGECAAIPYCFENLDIRVYSVEELCYVLRENAFLLDREILDKRLVKWIGEGVKLPELASMLAPLLHNGTSAGAFVRVILSYVGLYDEAEIARTEEVYLQGMGLNAYEKLKTRIDYMVENGKYAPALIEYDALMDRLPEKETGLRARIMHNKGTALCGLFLFEEAAQWSETKRAFWLIWRPSGCFCRRGTMFLLFPDWGSVTKAPWSWKGGYRLYRRTGKFRSRSGIWKNADA